MLITMKKKINLIIFPFKGRMFFFLYASVKKGLLLDYEILVEAALYIVQPIKGVDVVPVFLSRLSNTKIVCARVFC